MSAFSISINEKTLRKSYKTRILMFNNLGWNVMMYGAKSKSENGPSLGEYIKSI